MLDHAGEAISLVQDWGRSDLEDDRLLNLALTHLMEIVGEAAGRMPPDEQRKHQGIHWPRIIGMRNRRIHEYDTVDLDVMCR